MMDVPLEKLTSADRILYLRQSGLAEGLSFTDLSDVVSVCKDRIYAKEDVIFDREDPADSLYILNRGCVRISTANSSNQEKILWLYTIGDIFGEDVLGLEQRPQTRAIAHEESWISAISRDQLIPLIQQRLPVAINLVNILSERLLESRENIKSHIFLDAEHRLAKTVLGLAERYGRPLRGSEEMVRLRIPLSHEHLGRVIGNNRPYVSMLMSEFKRREWIGYLGGKLVINKTKIRVWHTRLHGDT